MTAESVPNTRRCRGCGALVALPADCLADKVNPGEKRLDQLAQAVCGCWVVTLPESGLVKFLGAIMNAEESQECGNRRVTSSVRH